MVVNKHKDELGRLERFARDIGDKPTQLATDAEFNEALEVLASDSEKLEEKSNEILVDYQELMKKLSRGMISYLLLV